jgi:hypothetical protein
VIGMLSFKTDDRPTTNLIEEELNKLVPHAEEFPKS